MSLPVRQGTPVDPGLFEARPVRCQNSATGLDLGVYAARWYWLMRPPGTGRRLIRSWERSATDSPGRGGGAGGCDGSSSVLVGGIPGEDRPQVAFTEYQHRGGGLVPGGEHETFRMGIRAGASGRDLHGFDTGPGQDCVERLSELPGSVADQEPELQDS